MNIILDVVDKLIYLIRYATSVWCVGEKITAWMAKARLSFVNLRHFYVRYDIRISSKFKCTVPRLRELTPKSGRGSSAVCFRTLFYSKHCSHLAAMSAEWWRGTASCFAIGLQLIGRDDLAAPVKVDWPRFTYTRISFLTVRLVGGSWMQLEELV